MYLFTSEAESGGLWRYIPNMPKQMWWNSKGTFREAYLVQLASHARTFLKIHAMNKLLFSDLNFLVRNLQYSDPTCICISHSCCRTGSFVCSSHQGPRASCRHWKMRRNIFHSCNRCLTCISTSLYKWESYYVRKKKTSEPTITSTKYEFPRPLFFQETPVQLKNCYFQRYWLNNCSIVYDSSSIIYTPKTKQDIWDWKRSVFFFYFRCGCLEMSCSGKSHPKYAISPRENHFPLVVYMLP